MNRRDTTNLGWGRKFSTTRWSLIVQANDDAHPAQARALGELCQLYWYPLYAYARYRGANDADAQDLTQSFFLHLIEKQTFRRVDREQGKFRSFLLACFQHHMATVRQHDGAKKRGGGYAVTSWEAGDDADGHWRVEPADSVTAETLFAAQWAKLLLDRVMTILADEYRRSGKAQTFELLRAFLTEAVTDEARAYGPAAAALGLSVGGVKTAVHRLRKRYAALLRQQVEGTLADPGEVDAEIHALFQALTATEGRL